MSDPKRLLDSEAADPEVRDLLRSMRDLKPGSGAAIGSWGAMAAKVAALPSIVPPPAPAPAAPHAAISGVSHALALKITAAVVATGVVGGGLYWAHAVETAAAPPAASVAQAVRALPAPPEATQAASDVPAVDSSAVDSAAPTAEAAPAASTPLPTSAAARISRLDAEASQLSKVRAALRGGDAHGALAALNQLQAQFPKGALGQERDVLAIEVLAANGNVAAAKRKASAFIAAHPSSPHSAKLERFLEAQ